MAEKSKISWTDATFNIVWGCTKISPGCTNCYAETLANRFGYDVWGPKKSRKIMSKKYWNQPIKWDKEAKVSGVRRNVFCSSMADNFEDHPTVIEELKKLWELIKITPNLNWLLLTKRSERISMSLPPDWGKGYDNVWLGVTCENNDYAYRADDLRKVPAKIRFISYEPAIGPLDKINLEGIHWMIYGGESGPGYREHDPKWAIDIRDRCEIAGVDFFYKQGSSLKPATDNTLEGKIYEKIPLRITN